MRLHTVRSCHGATSGGAGRNSPPRASSPRGESKLTSLTSEGSQQLTASKNPALRLPPSLLCVCVCVLGAAAGRSVGWLWCPPSTAWRSGPPSSTREGHCCTSTLTALCCSPTVGWRWGRGCTPRWCRCVCGCVLRMEADHCMCVTSNYMYLVL